MSFSARLLLYARLMRLHRPIGTLLLLWPTLWAVWIAADGHPAWQVVAIFVVGTFLMRSAGCVMNDIADAKFDGHVARTRERPLATGALHRAEALVLASLLCLIAFPLVLPFNALTIVLAFVAVFLAASYPLTKRFLAIPQAYLGIAFGFGIPMAFAAQMNALPPLAWVLVAANILWAIAYDTEYAMVDRDDDVRIGIRTAAITFGRFDVTAVMICYAGMLSIFIAIGIACRFGIWYYVGLSVAGAMVVYHYQLIRDRSPDGCFRAFSHNNWLGAAIFAGIALDYFTRR
ncbi:MAG: 4-hydroxybenzoate octaprenyltransferase [Betaproteobacteria bacterium]|nr:4-hydroxybenzoate octaprenyltransferase [Betaproteobacteria bacterium]